MANNLQQPVFYTAGVQAAQHMQHPSPGWGHSSPGPDHRSAHQSIDESARRLLARFCSAGWRGQNGELPPGL